MWWILTMAKYGQNLQDYASINDGSYPNLDVHHECEVCGEDGKNELATGFCVDCNDFLCLECVEGHKRTKFTKNHRIIHKDNKPLEKPVQGENPTQTQCILSCRQHEQRAIEYYCNNHDKSGCSVCMTVSHRICSGVKFIPDISRGLIDSQEYSVLMQQIQIIEESSKQLLRKQKSNMSENDKYFTRAKESINLERRKINEGLDEIEHTLLSEAETIQRENSKTLESVSESCMDTLKVVDKIKADMTKLSQSNQLCQMFLALKEAQKEVNSRLTVISDAEELCNIWAYDFQPNNTLSELLQNASTEIYGKFCKTRLQEELQVKRLKHAVESELSVPDRTDVVERALEKVDERLFEPRKDPTPDSMAAKHIVDINTATTSDVICSVGGLLMLSDRRFVLTDFFNFKVKVIDLKAGKVISEWQTTSFPTEVAQLRNKIAVTIPWERKISLLSVTGSLNLERDINVEGQCYSIATAGDQLVVGYQYPPKIELIDENGSVVKSVVSKWKGRKLFHHPNHMAVSGDQTTIYVSDAYRNTVTSLSMDGEVKGLYRDECLRIARGVCVDQYGFVYVCGFDSDNVHMLTADCEKVKILLGKRRGLRFPISVHCCRETNKLFVSMREKSAIKVFQLLPYG